MVYKNKILQITSAAVPSISLSFIVFLISYIKNNAICPGKISSYYLDHLHSNYLHSNRKVFCIA